MQTPMQDAAWHPPLEKREREAARIVAKGYVGLPESVPYRRRFASMQPARSHMEPTWRQVRDYIVPSLGRYLDDEDPAKDNYAVCYSKILDSSPTKMMLTAADGLHGGLTNQSEQWFSLYVGNYRDYRESFTEEAREWINNAQECTRDVMASSNFYTSIYSFYLEALSFGTALMLIASDPESYVRYYTKTAGSYWLSQDNRGRIDAAYIRISSRAGDIVKEYGRENCPERVIKATESGRQDGRFNIIQCIQPWNYFGNNGFHRDFRYEEVRYVEGGNEDEKILYRSGFRSKPFVAMRWADSGDSIYSRSCPGIDALPDVKQLQKMTLDYNKAIKHRVDPAYVTPSGNEIKDVIPGHVYQVNGDVRANMIQPIIVADFDIPATSNAMQALRDRISATLYNREILLVQSRERQITATEVNQLIQEKNAVLGPIIARTGDNALIPILDRTLEIQSLEWGLIQDPPDEIQGMEVKPYFTGQLAKAQRQGSVLQQLDQTLAVAERLMNLQSEALLVIDLEAALRAADEVDLFLPGTIRTAQKVEELKQAQQQMMAQQQQRAGVQQALEMAKTAGDTSLSPDTLAGQLAGRMGAAA